MAEVENEYKLLYENSLRLLQVFGTVFAFVLFAEINLLNLGFQLSHSYNKSVAIPSFEGVIIFGGISILLLIISVYGSYTKSIKIKHVSTLIEASLVFFILSFALFLYDIYATSNAWWKIGLIIYSNVTA